MIYNIILAKALLFHHGEIPHSFDVQFLVLGRSMMKTNQLRIVCGSVLALALVLCAAAGAAERPWADKMFPVKSHDFGNVPRGAKAEYRFEFTNPFVEDVHISHATSSCGCTSVTVETPTLKTYEKGAVLAHLNSDRFLGQKSATITVYIDRPYRAEVRLHVRSDIRSDVVFTPGSVAVGNVQQGEPVERVVNLRYTGGNSNWQITDIESTNPHIKCSYEKTAENYNQKSYQLRVKVDKDAEPGYLNNQLIIKTNDSYVTQVPLMVEGRIDSALTVSPSPLMLGVVKQGNEVTHSLIIRGQKPFKITSISSDDKRFRFGEIDQSAKQIHAIPVTFVADGELASGKIVDKIHIQTDQNVDKELVASVTVLPNQMGGQQNTTLPHNGTL